MTKTTTRLGVVMDPIDSITPVKDTTLSILLEAQSRDWEIHYFEQSDLRVRDGRAIGRSRLLTVRDQSADWFDLEPETEQPLKDLDVILMRKDPPFNMEYVYTTYVLERAQFEGALIINSPAGLRDVNEKAYTAWFPQCCPDNLITRSIRDIKAFLAEHGKIVLKPMDVMGGQSVFLVEQGDLNTNVICEVITQNEARFVQAQRFIPEINETGDKRILVIDGEPVPHVLARIPPPGDARGNMAVGGRTEGRPLGDRDRWICEQVAPVLKKKGLVFVGLDVIGDSLTEINVTSPTGIRELDKFFDLNISAILCDAIEGLLGR